MTSRLLVPALWPSLRECLFVVALLVVSGHTADLLAQASPFAGTIRDTEPLSPGDEREKLRVPPGFEIQLFAAEPEIQKPMNMAFDSTGRLWVTGSNDYPFPAKPGEAHDSIRILEDTDGDGRADKFTTFVEGITIPIGLYPYRDGVIAFSIPNITFFRDTDGDGTCDKRQLLYGPFDCTRDTHGLNNSFRRGFDGWLYACHGFNNHSVVAGRDGHKVDMQSGNTYRLRLDGSRIEQFTWGEVNPFGMTIDAWGDFYNSDCHTKPITLLIHKGSYQSFGKPHDGLGFVPPVMTHSHGSTAIAGVTQYTGRQFPEEYRDNLFVGNVMTSRVNRDVLVYRGSSVKAVERPDFVISDDPWFRPVDMQSGPDGALYIADFYNRVIGHYEVPLDHPGRDRHRGRIWRVVYRGAADSPVNPPAVNKDSPIVRDLSHVSVDELIAALGHDNLPYRMRATDELSDRIGTAGVPKLEAACRSS
ncbi:MAG: PVC-type heme-binding CxxCH protein, partial [Pirellulales bacterium]